MLSFKLFIVRKFEVALLFWKQKWWQCHWSKTLTVQMSKGPGKQPTAQCSAAQRTQFMIHHSYCECKWSNFMAVNSVKDIRNL